MLASKKEIYVADLEADPIIEAVECGLALRPGIGAPTLSGLCSLKRYGTVIAVFMASPEQVRKIKKRKGKLRITQGMIERGHLYRSPYGR